MKGRLGSLAALCLRTLGKGIEYLMRRLDAARGTMELDEVNSEATANKTTSSEATTLPDISYPPVGDLPTSLYTSAYFTMPVEFKIYPALVEIYRNELLYDVQCLTGYDSDKANLVIHAMEYYLGELLAGRMNGYSEDRAWLADYANMKQVQNTQAEITLPQRIDLAMEFLKGTSGGGLDVERCMGLLANIKRTGTMPNNIPMMLLDVMAFIVIPSYLRQRVDKINHHLSKEAITVKGRFSLH